MTSFNDFLEEQFNEIFDLIVTDVFENNVMLEAVKAQTALRQPWQDFDHEHNHKSYSADEFKKYYSKHVKPHIDMAEKPFHRVLHSAKSHNAKVLAAKKPLESFHDKVINRGRKSSEITDAIRGAILTKNAEDAHKVVNNLKKKGHVVHHEYKDFGRGESSGGYFGAHHVLLNVNGVKSEVQIMPKHLWNAKKVQHDIYSKYRSMKNPESHPDYEKDMQKSRMAFVKANKGNK